MSKPCFCVSQESVATLENPSNLAWIVGIATWVVVGLLRALILSSRKIKCSFGRNDVSLSPKCFVVILHGLIALAEKNLNIGFPCFKTIRSMIFHE